MADAKYLVQPVRRAAGLPTIARITIPLVIFLLGGGLLLSGLMDAPRSPNIYTGLLQSRITPSPQVSSGEELKALRATEDALLTTYGWVDKDSGVVRIPIDQAIDRLLQKGLPSRQPAPVRLSF